MKIEILKENLKMGLGMVEKIAGKNLSLPILQNVLLKAEDTFLSLVSTDLETTIQWWILTKIVKKGKAVVPAKLLSSFISSLPNDKVILEGKEQRLQVECKSLTTQIQGYDPEEFPIIPSFADEAHIQIDNKKFCQGLSQVIDVASPSQTRPEISGIYFSFQKNILKMVATDSFRLAEKTISLDKGMLQEKSFILPQRPAREILSIMDGREGMVTVHFSPNQTLFEFPLKEVAHPQAQITSRLIEGEYPNYQDIIPGAFKTHVSLPKDEFLNQVKTASLFSGKVNEIKITANPSKKILEISAKNPDLGEHQSMIPATIEGEPMEISFNYKFLVDGLFNIKSSEVVLDISKEEGPCVLKPVGDASYQYVVMPIKAI